VTPSATGDTSSRTGTLRHERGRNIAERGHPVTKRCYRLVREARPDYTQARWVQTTGPFPLLQHVLQSTCQHRWLADSTRVNSNSAPTVQSTAVTRTMTVSLIFLVIGFTLLRPAV